MRWMCCALVVLAAGLSADAAGAAGCAACEGTYGTHGASACGFWGFGLAPGCSETRPSRCDHVWDGYCQGKSYRLQRHAMRRAAHPLPMSYAQPTWGGAMGQPAIGGAWSQSQEITPVPDASSGKTP